jgi:SulP family sulfate permease
MTAAVLAPFAAPGTGLYTVLAAQLALMAGAVLLLCALLRVGFLANFFSRPVMSGFTLAVALVIAYGQLGALLGGPPGQPHWPSAALGLSTLALLVLARSWLERGLARAGLSPAAAQIGARLAPMFLVLGGMALVAWLGLDRMGVRVTGPVPSGLPSLFLATSSTHWRTLAQPALLVGFMIFLISMSAAQTLALKRQEKLHSNAELAGLGAANVASALSGGFPVTGSISRSAVNFAAGARTPLAGVVSALLLAGALLAPTGWLAMLPLPVLAATIIVAVFGMVELSTLKTAWRYDRGDALALLATAAGVLVLGVEAGVLVGVALSVGTLMWRASRPHIVVLGRIAGTEHFRDIERYAGETRPDVLLLRIDANLFFGNVEAVQERIEDELAARPGLRHLVLVMSSVSSIDTSALFALGELNELLRQKGIGLHFAEVKGPVLDRLKKSGLLASLNGEIHLSAVVALERLGRMDGGGQHG